MNKTCGMCASEWRYMQQCFWRAAKELSRPVLAKASAECGEIAAEIEAQDAIATARYREAMAGIDAICNRALTARGEHE